MQAKTTREEKGRALYLAGKVEFLDTDPKAGGEFVAAGSGGRSYGVYLDPAYGEAECECEDYRRVGGRCKHIVAAGLLRGELVARGAEAALF